MAHAKTDTAYGSLRFDVHPCIVAGAMPIASMLNKQGWIAAKAPKDPKPREQRA